MSRFPRLSLGKQPKTGLLTLTSTHLFPQAFCLGTEPMSQIVIHGVVCRDPGWANLTQEPCRWPGLSTRQQREPPIHSAPCCVQIPSAPLLPSHSDNKPFSCTSVQHYLIKQRGGKPYRSFCPMLKRGWGEKIQKQEGENRQRETKSNHKAAKEEKQVENDNCFLNPG